MTTYNTYQEAKIANPESEIYVLSRKTALMVGKFQAINDAPSIHFASGWTKCDPSKYCMTVEKFLADGHKAVGGDWIIDYCGNVWMNMTDSGAHNVNNFTGNKARESYILRAAALETKEPKRTKVEHVKWNFECAWHAIKAFEDGEKLYTKKSSEDFVLIYNAPDVLRYLYDLHERIETPIEWWEDAAEFMSELAELSITEDGDLRVMMLKDQIGFGMSRDRWCEFARILLEQGE